VPRRSYAAVLGAAVCCYAALGAVIRIIPVYVGDTLQGSALAVGLAVGAPALTGVLARPGGGRLADALGPRLVVAAGTLVMAAGALPMFVASYPLFLLSRLAAGVGEGALMSASVLWLLRLAGRERQGRALGHIGLANYAGLTLGPLLADALGGRRHLHAVFVAAAVLPLGGLLLSRAAQTADAPASDERPRYSLGSILLVVLGPGLGLLLVNVGYAALLGFGARAVGGPTVAVLPVYAGTVIAVRGLGGGIVDRAGAKRTLLLAAPLAAAGLVMAAFLPAAAALAGVGVLGVGQALAVPALGLLAIELVPSEQHGLASGVFFAWFDAGVGLGGPFAGAWAGATGPAGALAAAAGAVLLAPAAARFSPRGRAGGDAACAASASARPRTRRASAGGR
jgi:MFS family permease